MNDADILVIEDDKTIQNFIRITLKTKGYRCDLADDGLTGISCFYANNPDLILLDLGLPDLDGMEVLDQIRQESDVPVIVVSARGMEQEKVARWTPEPMIISPSRLMPENFLPESGSHCATAAAPPSRSRSSSWIPSRWISRREKSLSETARCI